MSDHNELRALQTAAGARFDEVTDRVLTYGNVSAEAASVRRACSLFDITGTAVLELKGPDAADYLHRMLTNSVKTLQTGKGARGSALKGDGRMVADLTVHRTAADAFLLLASRVCRESLFAHLDRYLITERAELADRTDSFVAMELVGPSTVEIATSVTGMETADLSTGDVREVGDRGAGIVVVRTDSVGIPGLVLLSPVEKAPDLWSALTGAGASPAGELARSVLRVEAGVPEFGRDMDENTIPLEANLKDSIDFAKGCFPGQEIVARIENLGHPAKLLVGMKLSSAEPVTTDTPLFFGEKNVGRITSSVESSAVGAVIALGYVKWDQREPGTELSLGRADSGTGAVVTAFPFVK